MKDEQNTESIIAEFSKRPLGDVKVLMIEDDSFISEMVLERLSMEGCVPYSCASGEEALELAQQYLPHVIILDLMLPGISGEELLDTFKKTDEIKNIPVIVFSNKSGEDEIQRCFDLGAAEYLIKASTEVSRIPVVITRVLGASR